MLSYFILFFGPKNEQFESFFHEQKQSVCIVKAKRKDNQLLFHRDFENHNNNQYLVFTAVKMVKWS